MRIDLPLDAVRKMVPFQFQRIWICPHDPAIQPDATLVIQAREDRAEGPSNYDPKAPSKQQPSELNWEGLREERGWIRVGEQVLCPACQAGVTVERFKRQTRRETLLRELAAMEKV